jgi:hypothetical protein
MSVTSYLLESFHNNFGTNVQFLLHITISTFNQREIIGNFPYPLRAHTRSTPQKPVCGGANTHPIESRRIS